MPRRVSLGCCSIAELTPRIVTPAPKCAIVFDGACVSLTRGDFVPRGICADLSRRSPSGCCSVPELTGRVVAPAPKCAVGFG